MAGCMEGLIPYPGPDDLTPVERADYRREQRRLFYVALTRCTDILMLSSVARLERRQAFQIGVDLHRVSGEFGYPIASSFLEEMGAPVTELGEAFLRRLM